MGRKTKKEEENRAFSLDIALQCKNNSHNNLEIINKVILDISQNNCLILGSKIKCEKVFPFRGGPFISSKKNKNCSLMQY
jgi:hypothetical protein